MAKGYLYQPLFTVSVEHLYFSDGLWKELNFVPVPETLRVLDANGALVKQTGHGIGVFYDAFRGEGLQLNGSDAGDMLHLGFKVYARDRTFANYTAPAVHREHAVLGFDNLDQTGSIVSESASLGRGEFASEEDFIDLAALVSGGMLDEQDRKLPPDFVVSIYLAPGWKSDDVPDYRIRFDARRSFWKYHLLGNMNRDASYIVDLDNRIEFESCGEAALPGDRMSRVFRSRERVPVLEKSNYRFQLREPGQGGGKILIKRLPVASESRLGREVINGKSEIVLENYVNF